MLLSRHRCRSALLPPPSATRSSALARTAHRLLQRLLPQVSALLLPLRSANLHARRPTREGRLNRFVEPAVPDRSASFARAVEHREGVVVFAVEGTSSSGRSGGLEGELGGGQGESEGEELGEEGFDLGLLGEGDDVGAVEEGQEEAGGVEDGLAVRDGVFELVAGRRGGAVGAVSALRLRALDGFDLGDEGFGGEEALVVGLERDGLVVERLEEVLGVLRE